MFYFCVLLNFREAILFLKRFYLKEIHRHILLSFRKKSNQMKKTESSDVALWAYYTATYADKHIHRNTHDLKNPRLEQKGLSVSSCLHNEQHVVTPPHSHGKEVELRAEPDGKGRTSTYLPMNQFASRMFSATPHSFLPIFLVLFLELISFLAISQWTWQQGKVLEAALSTQRPTREYSGF